MPVACDPQEIFSHLVDNHPAMPIERNVDLSRFNTLGLPGRAAAYQKITAAAQLVAITSGDKRFVLGGGSNLVLGGDFDGLVLHVGIPGKRLLKGDSEAFYVAAGAGENWHDFVQWTLQQGWPGLENLSLIPGTVGAAPIQNIGAYGREVGDLLHSVSLWDFAKREFLTLDRKQCRLAYRDSVFKQEGWHLSGRMVITEVVFRLPRLWVAATGYGDVAQELAAQHVATPTAPDIAQAISALRQRKLPNPATIPNCGSFFHNPLVDPAAAARLRVACPTLPQYPQPDGRIKLAAGWLIEQAGWKGRRLGAVGMYEKQALVLVNHGGATTDDVQRTMAAVQADVVRRFGVQLTPEPVFL
jgi:UDP-N-acetylmuramate dehydrogenase